VSGELSSRQVILGLPGSLKDPDGLLPDLLGRFLRQSTDGLLHTAEEVLDRQRRRGYRIVQAFTQG
jgi:hypothetical protein